MLTSCGAIVSLPAGKYRVIYADLRLRDVVGKDQLREGLRRTIAEAATLMFTFEQAVERLARLAGVLPGASASQEGVGHV